MSDDVPALDLGVDPAEAPSDQTGDSHSRRDWRRVVAVGLLPSILFAAALGCGYLKWVDTSARAAGSAMAQPVSAAVDGAVALLSYQPDTVDKDLNAARERLTGTFRDSYTALIHDVVIPGAKQRNITAVAVVPAAAPMSSTQNRAVVLLFINQTTSIGGNPPTDSASSVRVTLDRVGDRWLISDFTPV